MSEKSLREIIKEEYIHCVQSPAYFMKKYCYIQHPKRGRIQFNLYPFQEKVLTLFQENPYSIVLKSRQLGISTLAAGYSLWLMLFHEDKNILCIATKQDTAKNMVTKVKFMYENLPTWLREKDKPQEENKLTLRLNNGSQIKATSASSDAGRSEAVSLLLIDEAAFINNIGEIWASAQQTLATGGGCIALSTPYGTGNWFHKTWMGAEMQENSFLPIKLPWQVHPERNQAWRDQQDMDLGSRMAAQECFSGDVIVYTKSGPKRISDIVVGDIVLSHDGTYNRVVRTFSHESNDVYGITSTLNHQTKYVTGNHPFYVNNEWVEAKNVGDNWVTHFPSVAVPEEHKTIDLKEYITSLSPRHFVKCNDTHIWITKKHKCPRYIKFDYDLGYILGLYYAEGSKWKNVVCYSYNAKTERNTWVADLEAKLQAVFGIDIFAHFVSKTWAGSGNMYIKSNLFGQFIDLCFSGEKYCQTKHISEFVYQNASRECLRGILDGMMLGDGLLKKEYNLSLGLSSELLIYDILYINNLLGIHNMSLSKGVSTFPSGEKGVLYILHLLKSRHDSDNKIYSERIQEHDINLSYDKNRFLYDEGIPKTKLTLTPSTDATVVYNFEVENTHTYVTEYGVVHNCDCNFDTSGDTVFYPEDMEFIATTTIKEPLEKRGVDQNLWIWEPADYSRNYLIAADVARGDGKDYSTFHIIDVETYTQVGEYRGQLSTKDFGHLLVGVATEYNNALLAIENQSIGWSTVQTVLDRGYPNLYHTPKGGASTTYFDQYIDASKMVPGFTLTQATRPVAIGKFQEALLDRSAVIHSVRLLEEMKVFIWRNGRAEAQTGYNDDLVMAFSMAAYLRDTSFKMRQNGMDMSRSMLNNISTANNPYAGGYSTPSSNPFNIPNPYSNGTEDISWLL